MMQPSRVLGWLLLFQQFALAVGFVVSPARVSVTVPVAKPLTEVVTVQNNSADTARFRAYLIDWTVTPTGEDTVFEPSDFARSCSPWLQINPVEFEIPSDTSQEVRLTFTPPLGAEGGYWSMLYVESKPIPATWSTRVLLNARIGVRVFVSIAGTEVRTCNLTDLRVDTGESLQVTGKVANTGNVPVRLKGRMEIRGNDGKALWQNECNQLALPGQEARLSAKPDVPLPKGEYLAVLTLDYGGEALLVGERAVTVR